MPPEQCPECGRFLKRMLVESLAASPEPCPKCGVQLTASMFTASASSVPSAAPGDPAAAASTAPPVPAAAAASPTVPAAATGSTPSSVRPPDLPPDDVRDAPDPLAGWDVGVPTGVATIRDERPFPVDTVAVASAAAIGAVLGAVLGRAPVRDALLGALGGAVGAGAARRIWQLP